MVARERQQNFSYYLDSEKENLLFFRYVFALDFKEVEEFAVIYLTEIDDKVYEVIRYDCSKDESVNVHQFFRRRKKKRYLNEEKSFDTMLKFVEDIERNWRLYRLKFTEKQQTFI